MSTRSAPPRSALADAVAELRKEAGVQESLADLKDKAQGALSGLPEWALPAATGLGAAAMSAPLLYGHMRKFRPSQNPALRRMQDVANKAGDKFTRAVPYKDPGSAAGRLWDRIKHTGSLDDKLVYTDYKTPPKPPAKGEGLVRLTEPSEAEFVQGGDMVVGGSPRHKDTYKRIGDDKWEEAKFWLENAPHSMGKTENISDILSQLKAKNPGGGDEAGMLSGLQEELRQRYPQGFLMKEIDGLQSGGAFPSEKHNFNDLLGSFRKDNLKKVMDEIDAGVRPFDEGLAHLRDHESYSGRVLDQVLADPSKAIVQEKLPIRQSKNKFRNWMTERMGFEPSNEIRVHVEGGAAIPQLTTSRYDPTMEVFERKTLRDASNFAQDMVDKLPAKHRDMSFAMDVVPVEGGGFRIIESNPGGQSGFLYPDIMPTAGPQLRRQLTGRWGNAVAGAGAAAGAGVIGGTTAASTAMMQPDIMRLLQKQPQPMQELPSQEPPPPMQPLPPQAAPQLPAAPRPTPQAPAPPAFPPAMPA